MPTDVQVQKQRFCFTGPRAQFILYYGHNLRPSGSVKAQSLTVLEVNKTHVMYVSCSVVVFMSTSWSGHRFIVIDLCAIYFLVKENIISRTYYLE